MLNTLAATRHGGGSLPGSDPLRAVRLALVLTEEERKERIAYAIRTARERRGLTAPELAEKIGRGRGTVNDWEANRSTPSLVDLGPLCAALNVDPRLFAELPAIPPDPVAEYLIGQTVQDATTAGLRRARRRRAAVAAACLLTAPMWPDYAAATLNARGASPEYLLANVPLMLLPVVAWSARARH